MTEDIFTYAAIGFAAQLIDGATGMAYGITASSLLLGFGMRPAAVSASVHAAEVVTTGIAAVSHWLLGHVRWGMVARLAVPGMVGGAAGAYLLANIEANWLRPIVSLYLLAMGLLILWKAWRRRGGVPLAPKRWPILGIVGGFLDAIGGGGWGPVVTSTLLGRTDHAPRYIIGSVITAEFFVSLTIAGTFFFTIGLTHWPVIAGLILGGALAAPFAAFAVKALPDRMMMVLVGGVVILLSLRGLVLSLG